MSNIGKYSKFIVSLLTTAEIGLTSFYGTKAWAQVAVSLIGTALVLVVPNAVASDLPKDSQKS